MVAGKGRTTCAEHPHASLLLHRRPRALGSEGDGLAFGLDFERVASLEMQCVPQQLRDDDASRPVNGRRVFHKWRSLPISFRTMSSTPFYTLIGPDGSSVSSPIKGTLGGHRRTRVYGQLNCKAALRSLGTGRSYEQQRVFFADEATAIAAGYRPCANCMPGEFQVWKAKGGK